MNQLVTIFSLVFLLNTSFLFAQKNHKVVAGPMISFIDSYGTQMWFLLDSDAEKININVRDYDDEKSSKYEFDVVNKYKTDYVPYTIVLENLLPNKEYIASVFVDSVFVKEIDIFTKRPHLDDIQFLIGSDCTYLLRNNGYKDIFSNMEKTNSDFMVWLGNHVDILPSSSVKLDLLWKSLGLSENEIRQLKLYSTPSDIYMYNMIKAYVDIRENSDLNRFLSSAPQIATWGNLDFCDPNVTWGMKDTTHMVFESFWPNSLQKTYNYTYYDYGTYQRYTYNDLDLFLLDAMTFKSDSTLYGDRQIERMFQEIQNTGATFTIIASPTPFTFDSEDTFLNYKEEFDYFLYKLDMSDLDGVVLLSNSSVNKTFMQQYDLSNASVLDESCSNCIYEFRLPSIASGHYSLVNITGKNKKRTLLIETYDEFGSLVFKKELKEGDLKR